MHDHPHWLRGLLAAGLICGGLAGCGSSDHPYPVHGKLLYEDGQPVGELEGFEVSFTSAELHKTSSGLIQKDGSFTMSSLKDDDGVFPGDYRVSITQPHPDYERGETQQPIVALVYEDPEKSPLQAKVEAKTNEFTFKLKKLPKRRR
jgi:hypothetical protein